MANNQNNNPLTDFVSSLFSSEWSKLLRYAKVQLRKYGLSDMDVDGRAEDIVQELFCTAWDKAEQLSKSENPEKWLYSALHYKLKEAIKEDAKWAKCMDASAAEDLQAPSYQEHDELADLIDNDDYALLRKLYLEGYSYKELCHELNLSKSALGVKIHKIKKKFRSIYKNLQND